MRKESKVINPEGFAVLSYIYYRILLNRSSRELRFISDSILQESDEGLFKGLFLRNNSRV